MCDMSWDTYESCVEVTFAITKEEEIGGYLLPKWRLDEMWTKYGSRLEGFGFIPYDDHPIFRGNIDTWIWIAGFLGIILFLMIPMVIFWIVHEIGDRPVPRLVYEIFNRVYFENAYFWYIVQWTLMKWINQTMMDLLQIIYGLTCPIRFDQCWQNLLNDRVKIQNI